MRKKYLYEVYCPDCEQTRQVQTKPKLTESLCKSCNSKKMVKKLHDLNRKPRGSKVKYYYFCPTCPSIRVIGAKRKTSFCGDCSRTLNKFEEKSIKKLEEIKSMRYFRWCIECDEIKQVASKSSAGQGRCAKCASKNRKPRIKRKNTEKKVYKQVGIDGKQKVSISKPRKKKTIVVKSDEEMIAEFLKSNKPKVIEPYKLTDHQTGCKMAIASSY